VRSGRSLTAADPHTGHCITLTPKQHRDRSRGDPHELSAPGALPDATKNNGKLELPVLFLHGAYDYTCQTVTSRLAEQMRL
jgi:hypothetical protein